MWRCQGLCPAVFLCLSNIQAVQRHCTLNHFYNELAWCLQLPTGETDICPVAAVWRSRKEDLIAKAANHYLFESVCVLCVCMGVYSSFTEPLPLNVGPQYSAQFICLNRAAKVVLA